MKHICASKVTIIGSDNGLAPGRRQTIIWTSDGILLIGPLWTSFGEILIGIQRFHSRKCIWKCRLRKGVYLVSRPQWVKGQVKNGFLHRVSFYCQLLCDISYDIWYNIRCDMIYEMIWYIVGARLGGSKRGVGVGIGCVGARKGGIASSWYRLCSATCLHVT